MTLNEPQRERVWTAMTDLEHVHQWWGPVGGTRYPHHAAGKLRLATLQACVRTDPAGRRVVS